MPDDNSIKFSTSTQLNAAAKQIDPATRQEIAVLALAGKETVTNLSQQHSTSRKFFFNHRRFLRSARSERVGSSPTELLTGQEHAHWLELLGYTLFRQPEQGVLKAAAMRKAA